MGRISALTELTTLAVDDYLVVLDSSANIAKKITIANAFGIPELGYTAAGETWAYASATTITVPTNATTKYQRGNIIKITQSTGGVKYGVITVVAATLLTIEWLNGATLANEAITSPFYSSNATPLGAGGIAHEMLSTNSDWAWDSWTPSWTNVTVGNGVLTYAKYKQVGKTVHWRLKFVWGSTTSASGAQIFSLPVTANSEEVSNATGINMRGSGTLLDAGVNNYDVNCSIFSSTTAKIYSQVASGGNTNPSDVTGTAPFTFANGDSVVLAGSYEAA